MCKAFKPRFRKGIYISGCVCMETEHVQSLSADGASFLSGSSLHTLALVKERLKSRFTVTWVLHLLTSGWMGVVHLRRIKLGLTVAGLRMCAS